MLTRVRCGGRGKTCRLSRVHVQVLRSKDPKEGGELGDIVINHVISGKSPLLLQHSPLPALENHPSADFASSVFEVRACERRNILGTRAPLPKGRLKVNQSKGR